MPGSLSRIEEIHGGDMREQLVDIVLDAQIRQGCPGIDRSSIPDNAAHKAAVL